ncbi:hypothetical protein IscW_ISCW013284 [Ixodes scapularis]|uniref:Uncharacterized protein n=1 Tax=Ixodes scapularis TaxID=6945 RepID=B7QA55_IXOSC|nr:hypothetical protein IscW_ISCW013284 [Ixodes scapularis]|eukprot:XP_002399995.1 hypothetical protein IscW_ISCW013284 [Ixodes scapularis]
MRYRDLSQWVVMDAQTFRPGTGQTIGRLPRRTRRPQTTMTPLLHRLPADAPKMRVFKRLSPKRRAASMAAFFPEPTSAWPLLVILLALVLTPPGAESFLLKKKLLALRKLPG